MKITTPAQQLNPDAHLYYVESDSHLGDKSEQHIVVHFLKTGLFLCDCRDFMIRHLPNFANSSFSRCKHGDYVSESMLRVTKWTRAGARLISADDDNVIIKFNRNNPLNE